MMWQPDFQNRVCRQSLVYSLCEADKSAEKRLVVRSGRDGLTFPAFSRDQS